MSGFLFKHFNGSTTSFLNIISTRTGGTRKSPAFYPPVNLTMTLHLNRCNFIFFHIKRFNIFNGKIIEIYSSPPPDYFIPAFDNYEYDLYTKK